MSLFTNIHKIAAGIIPMQTIEYRHCIESVTDEFGRRATEYSEWTEMLAHVQPGAIATFSGKNMSASDYKEMGLDWSREYITIWIDGNSIKTLNDLSSTDQVRVGGNLYNVNRIADWNSFDGWKRIFCVREIED